jgi:hypothetical protein
VTWTAEAKSRIFEYSHGYPYLIQCLSFSAFVEGKTILRSDVESALSAALRAGEGWLEGALPNASNKDIRCFLKIVASGRTPLRSADMNGMGISSAYIDRLVKARVLKRISRGQYVLDLAPVVAYYHALRRGIEHPHTDIR